ncbi:MAG: hypothetical protein AB1393_08290 [Candidatus Edwardsbacteria bacterium]
MGRDIVTGLREVIQDLLVPELRAIKTELQQYSRQFEAIDKRFEAIDRRFEAIFGELKSLRKDMEEIKIGQAQILAKLDLERRITKVETILDEISKRELTEGLVKEQKDKYK